MRSFGNGHGGTSIIDNQLNGLFQRSVFQKSSKPKKRKEQVTNSTTSRLHLCQCQHLIQNREVNTTSEAKHIKVLVNEEAV